MFIVVELCAAVFYPSLRVYPLLFSIVGLWVM